MKKGLLVTALLILVLFATPVLAEGLFDTIGNVFDKVLSFGALNFIDSQEELLGLMRILVGILVGVVLFALSSILPETFSRNIRIAIAAILAIITAIFIPKTILAAIGTAYAAVFAFLLLVPILGGAIWLVVKTPTESRGMALVKIVGVLFVMWFIGEFNSMLTSFPSATVGLNIVNFSDWIDQISDFSYLIFVVLLIYLFIKFFFGGWAEKDVGEAVGKSWGWGKDKLGGGLDKLGPWWKSRALNQYLVDEKELKLLESIDKKLAQEVGIIEDSLSEKELGSAKEKDLIISLAKEIKNETTEAAKRFRRIKRRTWRQESGFDKVLKKLKESGVSNSEINKLKVFEKDILEKHAKTEDILKLVLDHLGDCDKDLKELTKYELKEGWPVKFSERKNLGGGLEKNIKNLDALFQNIKLRVEEAIKEEEKAIEDLKGLFAKTKELWK